MEEAEKSAKKNFSVAKIILASLWRIKNGNAQMLIKHPYARYFCGDKKPVSYRSSISRLEQYELVYRKNKQIISLTPVGEKEALFAFVDVESALFKHDVQKWDEGWRIVFFEMPSEKRKFRLFLEDVLKKVGFHQFQNGAWIYPYPAPIFLRELIADSTFKSYVISIATSIEEDKELREVFRLPEKKKKKGGLFDLF